ncbi:Uridine nucleosidase 1 [Rhizina undulata]
MVTSKKTPVWLDCDPDKVTSNALSLLTVISRTSIPVYAGSRNPFMRPPVHAPAIHGESGIDGTTLLPEPRMSMQPGNAVLAMYNAIMMTEFQSCVVVATGTLTNVALLFATFPDAIAHVRGVSIMGGAFGDREDCKGNIRPNAEFNIFCDPESAHSILTNPALSNRITLIPLDITHQVLATKSVLADLFTPRTNLRRMLHELLTFFSETYASVFNITAGPPLHDPLAVAAIIPRDEIPFEYEEIAVDVICHGDDVGRTVKVSLEEEGWIRGEALGKGGKEMKTVVKVAKRVDVEKFWSVLLECVGNADGRFVWEN